jgi:hypothetical protein
MKTRRRRIEGRDRYNAVLPVPGGKPVGAGFVGHGPFVINMVAEIRRARKAGLSCRFARCSFVACLGQRQFSMASSTVQVARSCIDEIPLDDPHRREVHGDDWDVECELRQLDGPEFGCKPC